MLHQGKAEAGAPLGTTVAGVDPVEALSQARQVFGRDAVTVIADTESGVTVAEVEADVERCASTVGRQL